MPDQPNLPDPNPTNPTTGRNAGFRLDDQGNVIGIWFTAHVDHFVEFTDQAVDLTAGEPNSDKPTA